MTENEAKEWIKYLGNQNLPYDRSPKSRKLACDIAIQALEEIQQYRAIGTVEEFKALKEKEERFDRNIKMFNEIGLEIRANAIDEFVATIIQRLTDAIYQKDVESMTNLINDVARELKAGGENECIKRHS